MKKKLIMLWLLFLALPGYAGQSVLGHDGVQLALLSPGGEHITLLNRAGDVDHLLVVSVAKKNTAYSRKSASPQRIRSVVWIDDETLALQIGKNEKYQVEVQPTGEIEILNIVGESMLIGGASNGETAIQQALTGRKLSVNAGLSSISGAFLVTDQVARDLWLIDIASDSIETLVFPPFQLSSLSVSPNLKYMAAEGITDSGDVRVMLWSDVDERGWRELDGTPAFVAVTDSGIAYAIMDVAPGVAGLVSIAIETGETTVLFQDRSFAVDQVMLDGFNRPFAARYVPGLPNWFYLDNTQRLAQLHKAFLAATPQADFLFVSSSNSGGTIIAKQMDDDSPSTFFVVDTIAGRADRLMVSTSALSIIGGDKDDAYTLQPIKFESETGSVLSGYISLPLVSWNKAKPTVVMLRDKSDDSRWQWGFDEETWFFHRQGFNVLMLNGNPASNIETTPPAAALMARISDVEDAIHWLVEQDITEEDQLCLFGRGTGAEMALLTALHSDLFDCAISLGGTFENSDLIVEAAQDNGRKNHGLHTLLIYGADDGTAQLASHEKIRESLVSFDIVVDTMPVEGERRVFSMRQNEVRAYARISTFLSENLDQKDNWPTLPLTYEQAIAMNGLHEALVERLGKGVYDTRDWRRWFRANSEEARQSLFEEQVSLYESYQAEIIDAADGGIGDEFVRFLPIRENTGSRAAGRQGGEN